MTVTTTTNNASFFGNDVTVLLPFNFRFFADTNLVVVSIDDATGVETLLTLGVDYTVQGAGNAAGGSVTLAAPLPTGKTVNVARVLDAVQLVEIINQGKFFPEIHENVFDYLTMLIQQSSSSSDRSMLFPFTDSPALNKTLPTVAARALKALGFDANGVPVVSGLTLADIEAQVPLAQAAADAAAASLDSFDDRYLGAKSSDPTTDNDGDPLIVGALYWNTPLAVMKSWSGTGWAALGGGAINDIFYENGQVITSSRTIAAGRNAGTFGPVTIADGVSVIIADGAHWSQV